MKITNLKAIVITATVFLAAVLLTTSAGKLEAGVQAEAPDSEGNCDTGWFLTSVGCCPDGTTNVHNFCESPDEHNQATNNYIACLAAEALKGITGTQAMSDCINEGS